MARVTKKAEATATVAATAKLRKAVSGLRNVRAMEVGEEESKRLHACLLLGLDAGLRAGDFDFGTWLSLPESWRRDLQSCGLRAAILGLAGVSVLAAEVTAQEVARTKLFGAEGAGGDLCDDWESLCALGAGLLDILIACESPAARAAALRAVGLTPLWRCSGCGSVMASARCCEGAPLALIGAE